MTTSNYADAYGIPSEAELSALANQLFTDVDGSLFEPDVCAEGIERLSYYYAHENSNVHRGAHTMAARSTDAFEGARQIVADFIGAPSKDNIIFVRGTTEGINLVAQSYVKPLLQPGDEIIVSLLEHHANIVPWQLIAQETGAVIKVIPVDKNCDRCRIRHRRKCVYYELSNRLTDEDHERYDYWDEIQEYNEDKI